MNSITIQQSNTNNLTALLDLLGRSGLAAIFLLAGIGKITGYEGNVAYMASVGLPAFLLPATIVFEIGASLAVIVGWQTRLAALALAGFSVVTAALFHNQLGDQMQFILFWKNIGLAGGFLLLALHGAGRLSLDARRR